CVILTSTFSYICGFFFSSRRRHTRFSRDWSSDVCSSDLGFMYILTNKSNTTLYVGVTSDIVYRMNQHKVKQYPKSFTARYNLDKLVYYEVFQMIGDAIGREKQLKAGSRAKKIALIESINPEWKDLFENVVREFGSDQQQIAALRSQ